MSLLTVDTTQMVVQVSHNHHHRAQFFPSFFLVFLKEGYENGLGVTATIPKSIPMSRGHHWVLIEGDDFGWRQGGQWRGWGFSVRVVLV
ncbi:hypothetical protein GQ457_16G015710 [Hibiscus cannabinus]